jgi:hypothetical protein
MNCRGKTILRMMLRDQRRKEPALRNYPKFKIGQSAIYASGIVRQ